MTIEELESEHRAARFPAELRGHDVDGIDFVMLDADIAGCVSTFLMRKHILDPWRTAVLGLALGNVERLVPQLEGSALEYFRRLGFLARSVLREVAATTKAQS
jgi:hypothetical protein